MAELSVALVYGQALFEAARDVNRKDEILEELHQLTSIFKDEPDFLELISTPVISAIEKKTVVKTIFERKLSQELMNFLYVLIDKGRVHGFHQIVAQYEALIRKDKSVSSGIIYSVQPLDELELSAFEEKTGKLLRKKVKLENKTDAAIIGGVKIFIEGKVIDASVRRQLRDLGESFRQAAL